MKITIICAILFLITACNRPDPKPQLKDPIYNDLILTSSAISNLIEAEKRKLEGFEKERDEVIPQTGQIKYAQKRVNESKARIARLEQEKQYYDLKASSQELNAKKSYLKAFKSGQTWPDPNEWTAYQAEKRLRLAKKTWDVKSRMKELGIGVEDAPERAASGH